jgi:hypothetical protein
MRSLILLALLFCHNLAQAGVCLPGDPPLNCGPRDGAILDLSGRPIPKSYAYYSVDFLATGQNTTITFSFRNDPGFLLLDDVSVSSASGANVLQNGGFEDGPLGGHAPQGWNYSNPNRAFSGGVVNSLMTRTGLAAYFDGAFLAYDEISQSVATRRGELYTIGFWLFDTSTTDIFTPVSRNLGGGAINLLVYADIEAAAVPEPGTLTLLAAGLLLMSGIKKPRRRVAGGVF